MTPEQIVQTYFTYWSSGKFEQALSLLSDRLTIEVPINSYDSREAFMQAVQFTCSMIEDCRLIDSFSHSNNVLIIYDMTLKQYGILRVAEYYTVEDGKITSLCQIHDTAPFRN